MTVREPLTYRDAGVDLEAAAVTKRRLRELVESTRTEAVQSDFGSFGGRLTAAGEELVASADGVGTKLEVAIRSGRHDTVGEDLVNHCVNDILAEGATPLAFLDYFACGELDPEVAVDVVRGVARGCRKNGCALLGGETAEMPGLYPPGAYDLAGFILGRMAFREVAARDVRAGDALLGLESSGIHTNGFSFVREVLFERMGLEASDPWPGLGTSVAEVLLRVHRSYLEVLRGACGQGQIRALAHITGGGIPGNLGRILPAELDAVVDVESWVPPAEFRFLAEQSEAPPAEMYRVFNMGVGMIAVVSPNDLDAVEAAVQDGGCGTVRCGRLVEGSGQVRMPGEDVVA
jgi:phosphoribosylformylglycinamidine cyclo-ligase